MKSRRAIAGVLALLTVLGAILVHLWLNPGHEQTQPDQFSSPSSDPSIPASQLPEDSLRKLAEQRRIRIGTAVQINPLEEDPTYRAILAREFNQITPENAMKFGRVHRERDRYDFTDAGNLVQFAAEHQMKIHGHTLVWHTNLPDWLTETEWTREELIAILRQHIYTVVGRFRGQVEAWDVVNEAIGRDQTLRDSFWLTGIGPEYIEMAFRWAHEADPQARLFYNDYDGEGMGAKANAIYDLVQDLRQKGVPIHGVGLQMHLTLKRLPKPEEVAANIQRLSALGLDVRITEMDVQTHDDENLNFDKLSAQAEIYQDILRVCLQAPDCTALTVWGIADHLSWIPAHFNRPDSPLLFDAAYQPKPAYQAIHDLLRNDEPSPEMKPDSGI